MIKRGRKGVILFLVMGTIMVVAVLSIVILRIIASQSRLTHHKVSRIRAYYASKAGMNLAISKLQNGAWTQEDSTIKYYCINGNVDNGVVCSDTAADNKIPYNVQIAIYPKDQPGINGTIKIDVKTDYAYP